ATIIDCGKRSTTDTAMRNPAAKDSRASNARTLHDALHAIAAAPRMFAHAAAAPYKSADDVTPAAVPVAPRRPSRRSPGQAPPGTAVDSSSNFSYARATAPRVLFPRGDTANDPFSHR